MVKYEKNRSESLDHPLYLREGLKNGSCHWHCHYWSSHRSSSSIAPFWNWVVLLALAKEVLKRGIVAYTALSEMVSGTWEQFNDIVAETNPPR